MANMAKEKQAASRPKAILLGSGDRRPKIVEACQTLRPQIESLVEIVGEDFSYTKDLSEFTADLAIVMGGRWFDSSCGQTDGELAGSRAGRQPRQAWFFGRHPSR